MQLIGNILLSLRNVKIRGENIVVFRAWVGGGRWSVGSDWVVHATSTKSGCHKAPERLGCDFYEVFCPFCPAH